jgi:hypothetical protein
MPDTIPEPAPETPSGERPEASSGESGPSEASESPGPGVPLGRRLFKKAVANPAGKLGGAVVGALIGIGVQVGVESTGVLGPGMDALIAKQAEGFEAMDAKLEALRSASDPQSAAIAKDLSALVDQQRVFADRTAAELRGAREEIMRLREAALASNGSVTGADLWLGEGEAATVGVHGAVFALVRFNSGGGRADDISVIADGKRVRLNVGEEALLPTPAGEYRVIYKAAQPRADGRVGFDVVPPAKASG